MTPAPATGEARPPARALADNLGRLQRAGGVAWAFLGLVLAVGVIGLVAYAMRVAFPPLVLALVIIVVLNPMVGMLERRGLHRGLATAVLYLAGLGVVAGVVAAIVPLGARQVEEFRGSWPEVRDEVEEWIDDRVDQSEGTPLEFDRETLGEAVTEEVGSAGAVVGGLLRAGERVFNVVLVLVTGPLLAFYLLVDLPRLRRVTTALVPEPARDEVVALARDLHQVVAGFLRGQLVVAAMVGALMSLVFGLLGLPFWLLLGLVAGVSDLIPLVGPIIGGIPAIVVALVTRDVTTALLVLAAMVAIQQLESHVLSPLVLRRAVKLHPAAVVLALLVGGSLGGLFGVLLAAPVLGALKVLAGHAWKVHVLGLAPGTLAGEEDGAPSSADRRDDEEAE